MPSQGKSEGFDSCDQPSNLTQIGLKSSINQPVWPWNLMNDLEKQYGTSSTLHLTLCIISNPLVIWNFSYSPEMLNSGKNWRFFVPRDVEIWWMTLINHRAPLLYYIKLCAAFQSHWHIQTGVTVRERSIGVKIGNFFVPGDFANWLMTLQNNRAPLLCCFNLCASFQSQWWIQTGVIVWKRPIWLKIDDFFFAVWPWNLTDDIEEQ